MPRKSLANDAPESVLEDLRECVFSFCEDNVNPPTLEEVKDLYKQKKPDVTLSLRAINFWLEMLVTQGKLKKLKSAKRKFAPLDWSGQQTPVYSQPKTP